MIRPFWESWIFWAYAFVWAPFFLAALMYATKSPWRVTPVGRALMTLLLSMTAVLTFVLAVLAVDIGEWLTNVLRGVTLGGVGIAGWMFLRELMVLQRVRVTAGPCPKRRATDVP